MFCLCALQNNKRFTFSFIDYMSLKSQFLLFYSITLHIGKKTLLIRGFRISIDVKISTKKKTLVVKSKKNFVRKLYGNFFNFSTLFPCVYYYFFGFLQKTYIHKQSGGNLLYFSETKAN